jgi:hypothetical protein
MGHEDVQTTMRYVHAVPQDDAPKRLGEHWPAVVVPYSEEYSELADSRRNERAPTGTDGP